MHYDAIINSPIGHLGIKLNENQSVITRIDFLDKKNTLKKSSIPLIQQAITELENYFNNPHHIFAIPIDANGTNLQKKIWNTMQKIPVGKTLSYGELAERIKTSPRVIGNACRANPIPIFIPCHRIVAKNHLGGFAGAIEGKLIDMKSWLLDHEAN
jgi:methylated-DNA-[protein]-cysteine S-methyltransferase